MVDLLIPYGPELQQPLFGGLLLMKIIPALGHLKLLLLASAFPLTQNFDSNQRLFETTSLSRSGSAAAPALRTSTIATLQPLRSNGLHVRKLLNMIDLVLHFVFSANSPIAFSIYSSSHGDINGTDVAYIIIEIWPYRYIWPSAGMLSYNPHSTEDLYQLIT
jgi:hypothetical protein